MSEDFMKTIDEKVRSSRVVLFMKGTPDAPMCGFSNQVVQILRMVKAEFSAVDIIGEPEYRQHVPRYSNWPTFPQLFIDGKLVGGCDIVTEMYEKGDLEPMIQGQSASS